MPLALQVTLIMQESKKNNKVTILQSDLHTFSNNIDC